MFSYDSEYLIAAPRLPPYSTFKLSSMLFLLFCGPSQLPWRPSAHWHCGYGYPFTGRSWSRTHTRVFVCSSLLATLLLCVHTLGQSKQSGVSCVCEQHESTEGRRGQKALGAELYAVLWRHAASGILMGSDRSFSLLINTTSSTFVQTFTRYICV